MPLAATFRLLTAACAVAALSAAQASCGESPGPSSQSPGPTSGSAAPSSGFSPATLAGLNGHRYVSTRVQGRELVDGTKITVSFEDGRVSANVGCNGIGGTATVEDGRLTKANDGVSTQMYCGKPAMEQEDWFSALLQAGVVASVNGDALRLSGRGVTIDLVQRDPQPTTPPITGTRWELVSTAPRGGTATPVPGGVQAPTLEIAADGKATIFFGCNRGAATTTQEDGFVTFTNVSSTRRLCRGEAAGLEQAVRQVLTGKVAAGFEGDRLSLAKDGNRLLFRAR